MNRAAAMDMQRGLERAEAVKGSPHRTQHTVTHSLEGVLGEAAWQRSRQGPSGGFAGTR